MTDDQGILAQRQDPRIYGDGHTVKTPIEGAARAGYYDARAGRGFSAEYDTALPQWQRNYEAGRQWATALRASHIRLPRWPEGGRVPQPLLDALARVRRETGSGTRPEDTPPLSRPEPDDKPMSAVVPRRRGRRLVDYVTRPSN